MDSPTVIKLISVFTWLQRFALMVLTITFTISANFTELRQFEVFEHLAGTVYSLWGIPVSFDLP